MPKLPFSDVIPVTNNDLDTNPKFSSLLQDLQDKYLNPGATSQYKARELERATDAVEMERGNYLKVQIIRHEISELLLDEWSGIEKGSPSSRISMQQALQHLEHQLTVAGSCEFLSLSADQANPEVEHSLLGITPRFLTSTQMPSSVLASRNKGIQQHIIPTLEARLARKCDNIAEFYNGVSPESNANEFVGDSRDVAADIAAEVATLTSEQQTVRSMKEHVQTEFSECFRALSRCLLLLVDILSLHKHKLQREADDVESRSLMARCHTMARKLAVVKNQFLKDTYTSETVPALKVIKEELDAAYQEAKTTFESSQARLQQYQSVGLGFDALVTEYTGILNDIKDKEWAVAELMKANEAR